MPHASIDESREPAPLRVVPLLLVTSVPLVVLALHAYQYLPFLSDDSLISLRYAERLLDGHGLTWTAGERVEGYSNLLWILCCALLGSFGLDLITAARTLVFLGMGAAILAAVWLYRPREDRSVVPALAAGTSMALTGTFAVWTVGGLEQPLLLGLLAWATVLCIGIQASEAPRVRDAFGPGVLLGLACWTRPDSPIFVVVLVALIAWSGGFSRFHRRAAAAVAATALAFYLAQLAFRLSYYGDWVPNPAHAKLVFTNARLVSGVGYLSGGLLPLFGLLVPALLAVGLSVGSLQAWRRVTWFWAPAAVWSVYVVAVGGDIFPGRRHLAVVILFLGMLSGEFFARLRTGWVAGAALAASLGLLFWAQWEYDPEHRRARTETWEWDGEVVGTLLQRAFAEREPLVAVTAAGTVPYFSRLPSLDMLGLNDRYLATHPPKDLGEGDLGHELGDGAYVLSRAPDLVIFCSPAGSLQPCFRSGRQMVAMPEFEQHYRLVPFLGGDPYPFRSLIWVRIDSEKVGASHGRDRHLVPGYLLTAGGRPERTAAALDREGRIGMQMAGADASLKGTFSLAPGRWEYRVESTGDVEIRVERERGEVARGAAGTFMLGSEEVVKVSFVIEGSGHVRRVVLERS
jgi:hypothetical protein